MSVWAAWTPAIITLLTVIFGAGRIYGRIGDQEITIKRHDEELREHSSKLDEHALELATSRGWRDGFQAGKKEHRPT